MAVEILEHAEEYGRAFADLNYEWLEEYFYVEDYDREVLENPDQYILKDGGMVFYARLNGQIVGTVALIVRGEGVFELSKMAVTPAAKGQKIGQKLMEAALDYSRVRGMKRVMLDSNRKLTPALNLYLKNGFVEIPVDPNTPYERCNIRMEIWL